MENEQKIILKKLVEASDGTKFQKLVWLALLEIPQGSIITYNQLAEKIGRPKAIRAVANAVGANPFAPEVPCHRVVAQNGKIGGYSGVGGIEGKRKLLNEEGIQI